MRPSAKEIVAIDPGVPALSTTTAISLPIGDPRSRALRFCGARAVVAVGSAQPLFRRPGAVRFRAVPLSVSRHPRGSRRGAMPSAGDRRLPLQSLRRARPPACVFAAMADADPELPRHLGDDRGRRQPRPVGHSVAGLGDPSRNRRRGAGAGPGGAVADDGLRARAGQLRSRHLPADRRRLRPRPRAAAVALWLLCPLSPRRVAQILPAGAAGADGSRAPARSRRRRCHRRAGRARPCRLRSRGFGQGAGKHPRAFLFFRFVFRAESAFRLCRSGRRPRLAPYRSRSCC